MGNIIIANPEQIAYYAPADWLSKDIEVLPDKEDDKQIEWTIKEKIGIGIVNPRAMTMGIDYGAEYEKLKEETEEEKETRRIENKGW